MEEGRNEIVKQFSTRAEKVQGKSAFVGLHLGKTPLDTSNI
jgi:hypothetical protein